MILIAPTIKDLVNNPKTKVMRETKGMIIYINYEDAMGKSFSEEELIEELERARKYVGTYRYQRQGLVSTKLALQNFIEDIEISEKSPSNRYKLLKYAISRLYEECDSVLDYHALKPFNYSFKKEKGKKVLKVDYDLTKRRNENLIREKEKADEKINKVIEKISEAEEWKLKNWL